MGNESKSKASETLPAGDFAPKVMDVPRLALRVKEGEEAGKTFCPLGVRTLVGREPWCDLVLKDPKVSGQHCEIVLEASRVRVIDRASTNGTWVGRARVVEVVVPPGTELRVGSTIVEVTEESGTHELRMMSTDPTGTMVGTGAGMRRLFDTMSRVSGRDVPVLILGETGTGKTATAKAMHRMSTRAQGPFVAVNCSALPAEIAESVLFGHVKGAFTGAYATSSGIFEQARGGSVLLDEIGDLPLNLQPKLLQVLDSKRVRPIGASQEIDTDFRLFAATNRKLPKLVADGRFRRDLYYRIAVVELAIPPLRERTDDIQLLAKLYLSQCTEDGQRGWRLGADALRLLESHSWPGNVRELNNVLERAVALSDTDVICADQIFLSQPEQEQAVVEQLDWDGEPLTDFKTFKAQLLARNERSYFVNVLEACGGNVSKAARRAGISRSHLQTMMRRYGLGRESD